MSKLSLVRIRMHISGSLACLGLALLAGACEDQPPAEPSAATHAPHFNPAGSMAPMPELPSRLPANAEDTGRYNERKPKAPELVELPETQEPAASMPPPDPELVRRQQDYLARWKDLPGRMPGASAEELERARADLKAQAVGQ